MRTKMFFLVLVICMFCLNAHSAVVPQQINYHGNITSDKAPFNGKGYFKFALVDKDGYTTYWSNDETSINGKEPENSIEIIISNGIFNISLGNTSITNMTAIPESVFQNYSETYLRVWFSDGSAFEQLSPDTPMLSVPYAYTAVSAEAVGGLKRADIESLVQNSGSGSIKLSEHNVTELKDVTSAGSGNIMTGAERTKLDGIEAGADKTDTDNVNAAGAIMDSDFTDPGIMTRTTPGSYIIVADNSTNWNTAVLWGNHAAAGYATQSSLTLLAPKANPTFTGSVTLPGSGIWNSSGNVGIGTATPSRLLHVAGSNPRILIDGTSSTTNPTNTEINFRTRQSSQATPNDWSIYMKGIGSDAGDLRFYQDGDKVTIQNYTGNVGIGTNAPKGKLHVNGSFATAIKTVTDDYSCNINDSIILADAINGRIMVTLPEVNKCTGRIITIKKIDNTANHVHIKPKTNIQIDGTFSLQTNTRYKTYVVTSNGTKWHVLSSYTP